MFTGIVTDVGTVERLEDRGDLRVRIRSAYDPEGIAIGASIACDGICLTVVDRGPAEGGPDGGSWFEVDLSAETARPHQRPPQPHRLGPGHAAEPRARRCASATSSAATSSRATSTGSPRSSACSAEGDSTRFVFRAPDGLARYIAPKGSIALNGTSLTVNEVEGADFGVNIIPHTRTHTTWGAAEAGDLVNLEVDTLARYVARLNEFAG